MTRASNDRMFLALAALALAVGFLIYATLRPPLFAFWPWHWSWTGSPATHWWREHTEQLPSLLHAFAFSVFLALAVSRELRWRLWGCASWGAIAIACEAAQSDFVHEHLPALVLRGSFDWFDIAASALGAAAAAVGFWLINGGVHES